MGGNIGVSSTPGEGSTFWFTLNVELDLERQEQLTEQRQALTDKHIAIVFSNADHGKNIQSHFDTIGMKTSLYLVDETKLSLDDQVDVVLTSDHVRKQMPELLQQCQRFDIPMVISRSNYENFKEEWVENIRAYFLFIPADIVDVEYKIIEAISGSAVVSEKKAASNEKHAKRYNILVAEDNSTNQLVIDSLLTSLGQSSTLVENGEQAVSTYTANPEHFDLILMDCEMPVLDGYKATKAIRQWEKDHKLESIYISAITAHALSEHEQKCLDTGMNQVIIKPIKRDHLSALLDKLG